MRLVARNLRGLGDGGALLDEVGGALADHNAGGVGVPADNGWHHRGIGHAQPLNADHAQLGIDDGQRIAAHLAGANGMIDRFRPAA